MTARWDAEPEPLDALIHEIRRRAVRRYLWRRPLQLVVIWGAVILAFVVLGSGDLSVDSLVPMAVGAFVGLGIAGLAVSRQRQDDSLWAVRLPDGLPGPERRQVRRDLFRGQPNQTPLLREIETRDARRWRRQLKFGRWFYPLALVLFLAALLRLSRSPAEVALFTALAVLSAGAWAWGEVVLPRLARFET